MDEKWIHWFTEVSFTMWVYGKKSFWAQWCHVTLSFHVLAGPKMASKPGTLRPPGMELGCGAILAWSHTGPTLFPYITVKGTSVNWWIFFSLCHKLLKLVFSLLDFDQFGPITFEKSRQEVSRLNPRKFWPTSSRPARLEKAPAPCHGRKVSYLILTWAWYK